jgi:hypothetical protein
MIKWLKYWPFRYRLHRLHEEPVWLAAWRACRRRARIGTPAYWKKQRAVLARTDFPYLFRAR